MIAFPILWGDIRKSWKYYFHNHEKGVHGCQKTRKKESLEDEF